MHFNNLELRIYRLKFKIKKSEKKNLKGGRYCQLYNHLNEKKV